MARQIGISALQALQVLDNHRRRPIQCWDVDALPIQVSEVSQDLEIDADTGQHADSLSDIAW
jgi:hypothetical protein